MSVAGEWLRRLRPPVELIAALRRPGAANGLVDSQPERMSLTIASPGRLGLSLGPGSVQIRVPSGRLQVKDVDLSGLAAEAAAAESGGGKWLRPGLFVTAVRGEAVGDRSPREVMQMIQAAMAPLSFDTSGPMRLDFAFVASEIDGLCQPVTLDALQDLVNTCNVNGTDRDGFSPVYWAVSYGNSTAVQVLVRAGANLDAAANERRFTPLHEAARNGDLEMTRLLVKLGANRALLDSNGRTALAIAQVSARAGFDRRFDAWTAALGSPELEPREPLNLAERLHGGVIARRRGLGAEPEPEPELEPEPRSEDRAGACFRKKT